MTAMSYLVTFFFSTRVGGSFHGDGSLLRYGLITRVRVGYSAPVLCGDAGANPKALTGSFRLGGAGHEGEPPKCESSNATENGTASTRSPAGANPASAPISPPSSHARNLFSSRRERRPSGLPARATRAGSFHPGNGDGGVRAHALRSRRGRRGPNSASLPVTPPNIGSHRIRASPT
ncbi:hypothetical protein SKAU_G00203670 [Synaphobranchus kaupii]|uniref:Uncharacterized protein n=1 Tax=Synaphobranchus kaupii TaxID=118154 RepID=A0A9Q1FFZ5_SYNKA|nr:hypothetical protein SKAU_G00203670 [Synaphobranchus kaupii]